MIPACPSLAGAIRMDLDLDLDLELDPDLIIYSSSRKWPYL